MTDVLIKGMDMPKSCSECKFFAWKGGVGQHCAVDDRITFHATLDGFDVGYERNGNCPLVPVPPHGRLIDADVLYEKTAESEAQALHLVETHLHDEDTKELRRWSTALTERSAFRYDIAYAPTVIEASEDGGEDETAEADCEWSEEEQAYIEQGYMDTQVGLPDLYMN